ncbi:MAG: phosphate ABC transporter substrate-binding protein [Clostridium sp.]|nr:phosphate ABC transporter substrate-binding protein [Clostridium sp.]
MKKRTLKLIMSGLMIAMMGGALAGCGDSGSDASTGSAGSTSSTKGNQEVTIAVSGSTSVGPLMEKVAKAYEAKNSNVSIEINQVGSSAGIKDTINGVAELGMSSRDLKDEEKASGAEGTAIAYDGIAVIVNPANKITNLTLEQLKDVYTGKITNWKDLGGEDGQIVVVSREDGSGTRDAFQEIVGYKSEELVADATIADGSGNIKTTVSGNKNAIGFVSFSYVDNTVNAIEVNGVKPEEELAKSGEYKLSRPFLIVTKKDTLTDEGKKVIDYILSEEGQKIVEEDKLIKIK